VRTQEDIEKEVRAYLGVKLLICLIAIIACGVLWAIGQHWSLIAKIIAFGLLLIVLGVTVIFGVLESAAYSNSSHSRSKMANISGIANLLLALMWLLTLVTGIAIAFQ
jgi:hypothetical protein